MMINNNIKPYADHYDFNTNFAENSPQDKFDLR